MWKWKSLSCVWLFVTPWTTQSRGFSRPEYWEKSFPSLGDIPNPWIEPRSPTSQANSLPAEPPGKPKNTGVGSLSLLQGNFPTQESNQGLLHWKWILYQLSYEGSQKGKRGMPKGRGRHKFNVILQDQVLNWLTNLSPLGWRFGELASVTG